MQKFIEWIRGLFGPAKQGAVVDPVFTTAGFKEPKLDEMKAICHLISQPEFRLLEKYLLWKADRKRDKAHGFTIVGKTTEATVCAGGVEMVSEITHDFASMWKQVKDADAQPTIPAKI